MLACNKPLHPFDSPQKSFGFVCVNRVLEILLMCYNFQVIQTVVGAVKVFVIYFQSTFNSSVKCFPYHAMHTASRVFGILAQTCNKVIFQQLRLYKPITRITNPSFTVLDRMSRGYAGAQKLSDLFKGSAVLKHLLGFRNLDSVKGFASSNSAHIPKIAYLVQIFKIQNWFPRFHSLTPFNMNGSIA